MRRILAHKVIYDGKTYPLSIAEISDDGKGVKISPFTGETANTSFVNGAIEIAPSADGAGFEIRTLSD